jgi:hypothetical protein
MPHLGSKVRDDVEPDDVRRMLAALKKCGLSDGTVSRTLDVARQLLPKAATEGVKFRIKVRRRMKIATRQQAAAIEAAIDPRYRLFARTLFTTGCRWGEAVAPPRHRRRAARYGLRAEGSAYGRGGRPRLLGARIRQDRGPMRDITIPGDLASAASGNVCLVDDAAEPLIVGVVVAPDDVAADHAGLLLVAGVVGPVEREVPQRRELRLDSV